MCCQMITWRYRGCYHAPTSEMSHTAECRAQGGGCPGGVREVPHEIDGYCDSCLKSMCRL
ncbi:hypothetical protein QC762_0029030 [Podospora pseudocomata]|uniref:Uncharacterized protein n=2 Tax=Podospora TaxID=5144 RepID=A0ABR0GS04_9PEZI|nr:hypothetical protein QC761_0002360 [Podospora bellae-mahoneyi]KAK4658542.1 hypothetical protein QC762_0029030 [Podospora pseudocomata]